jgi:hypothetical protein
MVNRGDALNSDEWRGLPAEKQMYVLAFFNPRTPTLQRHTSKGHGVYP